MAAKGITFTSKQLGIRKFYSVSELDGKTFADVAGGLYENMLRETKTISQLVDQQEKLIEQERRARLIKFFYVTRQKQATPIPKSVSVIEFYLRTGVDEVMFFVDVLSSEFEIASSKSSTRQQAEKRDAYVFISYSHTDQPFALGLSDRMSGSQVSHFIDENEIAWGDPIPGVIHRALRRSTHMIVLISPGSEKSQWVAYETGYASGRGMTMIPYLLHPAMQLPGYIRDRKYLRTQNDESRLFAELRTFRK